MTDTVPLLFRWNGEGMEPLPHLRRKANEQYVIGQIYRLTEYEERSDPSHKHEFAWLREAWKNLPETIAELYPTPEHLRKRALIQAGFFTEELIDVGTNAGALRVAAFARKNDEFAHVVVRGTYVAVHTAKSQSRRAMDRKTFQESKQKVMDIVADLIGVKVDDLARSNAA